MFPQDEKFAAIGLATLRKDGFVSYDATMEEGVLTTKPILFELGALSTSMPTHPGQNHRGASGWGTQWRTSPHQIQGPLLRTRSMAF